MKSPRFRRRRARARRSRADAAEQWIVWRDADRETEWAATALLAFEALARLVPSPRPLR